MVRVRLLPALAAMVLAMACEMLEEEPREEPTSRDVPEWTQLSTADIAERWQTLPGSTGAAARSTAAAGGARILAASDVDDTLREAGFTITDARRYGTCDVFTARLNELAVVAFLDCVDRQESLPGHYHVAAACGFEWNRSHTEPSAWAVIHFATIVVRAGQQKHSEGSTVAAALDGKSFDLVWQQQATVRDPDAEQYAAKVINVDWAYYTTTPVNPFAAAYPGAFPPVQPNGAHDHFRDSIKPSEHFTFTLAQQGGSFEFKSNDGPALREYARRCTVLAGTPPSVDG